GVKEILGRIERLFPTFEESISQHAVNHGARDSRKTQELLQRKRPTLDLEKYANLLFFFGQLLASVAAGRCGFPSNNSLGLSLFVLDAIPNLNQPEPLQFLEKR